MRRTLEIAPSSASGEDAEVMVLEHEQPPPSMIPKLVLLPASPPLLPPASPASLSFGTTQVPIGPPSETHVAGGGQTPFTTPPSDGELRPGRQPSTHVLVFGSQTWPGAGQSVSEPQGLPTHLPSLQSSLRHWPLPAHGSPLGRPQSRSGGKQMFERHCSEPPGQGELFFFPQRSSDSSHTAERHVRWPLAGVHSPLIGGPAGTGCEFGTFGTHTPVVDVAELGAHHSVD
jgi:hypothetical protein